MKEWVLIFLTAFWTGSANAAVVLLKDGGRLEGSVLRQDDGVLVLETAQGTVSIPSDKVQSVDYAAASTPTPAAPIPQPAAPPRRWRSEEEDLFGPLSQTLSIDFGLAAPLSDVNFSPIGGGSAGNGDVGPLVGLQYLHDLRPGWAAGGELQYANRSATDSQALLPNADAHVFGDSLLLLGVLKYSLTDRRRARPFVLAGLGAGRTSTTIDARPDFGYSWSDTGTSERRRLIDGSAWGLASTVRLGVDFALRHAEILTVEAGWMGLSGASYPATAQGSLLGLSSVSASLDYFTLAARWGFRF